MISHEIRAVTLIDGNDTENGSVDVASAGNFE